MNYIEKFNQVAGRFHGRQEGKKDSDREDERIRKQLMGEGKHLEGIDICIGGEKIAWQKLSNKINGKNSNHRTPYLR